MEIGQQEKLDQNIRENMFTRMGVTKPYTVFVLMAVIIILGIFAFSTLKMELYPNMNIPYIALTSNPTMQAQMTEDPEDPSKQIPVRDKYGNIVYEPTWDMNSTTLQEYTALLETALQYVSGVENITSMTVVNGTIMIFVEFVHGTNVDSAMIEVDQELRSVNHEMPFRLSQNPDVKTDASFQAPILQKIGVDMIPVFVFSSAYLNANPDIEANVVLSLKQIPGVADVESSLSIYNPDNFALLNGEESISFRIQKTSDAVTADVTSEIMNVLNGFASNPEYDGFEFTVTLDQGEYIEDSINDVLFNLIIGGLLSIVILFLFMRSWKMTLAIAISIPLSVIFTFVLMYFMGIGLNIVSMSGLALAVGMLVDNSVIVLENIFRLRQKGMSVRESALKGASQIMTAVIAATLTTVSVFVPMLFITGMMMEVFMDMIWVMTFALFASLIVAVAFLPSIISTFKIGEKKERKIRWIAAVNRFIAKADAGISKIMSAPKRIVKTCYNKVLNFSVRLKWLTLVTVLALFGGSIGLIFINGFVMMPPMDSGEFGATVSINAGYQGDFSEFGTGFDNPYDQTTQYEQWAEKRVQLTSAAARILAENIDSTLYKDTEIGSIIEDVAITYSTGAGMSMLSSGGLGLSIDIILKEDRNISTSSASEKAYSVLGNYLRNEANGFCPPENQGASTTNFVSDVSMTASIESLGADNVVVTLAVSADLKPDMAHLQLRYVLEYVKGELWDNIGQNGGITKIENNFSDYMINRTNKRVTGSLTISVNDTVSKVQERVDAEMNKMLGSGASREGAAAVLEGVTQLSDGFAEQFEDTYTQLVLAIVIGIVLVYLVMVAMFQSFLMPFIILITVPLAMTGGFALLAACGMPISVAAMVGMLILMGVIVNNGIVMIDYINQARRDGLTVREAVIAGANVRARPILITALTTIIAMIPMSIGLGASGSMMQPLAIVTIGGLAYATLMSLFAVPAFYSIFVRDKKNKSVKEKTNEKTSGSELENEQNKGAGAPILPGIKRQKS